ncbi:HAMP domain-containing histidine kinase [Streptomyces sp. PLAI1-29]|uniref:histidine kinase n=1 Tax=Streptomyces zingiberis TaxID=2053010 RepID=A0ABX1BQP6_9ACTN|nr:HAMP domain-containing histidine kinase [Streptomyces zingiberis]
MRRLPLRTRLTLLTAVAVAVAVAVSAFACWFLTRDQLRGQIDTSLRNVRVPPEFLSRTVADCRATTPQADRRVLPGIAYGQVVTEDGGRCVADNSQPVEVTAADAEVAAGTRDEVLRDGVTEDGEPVRVLTRRVGPAGGAPGYAVSVARSLRDVEEPLGTLALLLTAVAGVGVLGAATAGLWIARTGLRPVDRLTGAVEHVARTEDLAVRIPVEGEDEIARLSRSFNAMTAALASSRDRQQQLIADAGHELRTPLTSLRTNIDLLVRSEETGRAIPAADRAALLDSVRAQTKELAALIGDLQELARPDTAAGAAPPEVTGLHAIAARAVERARLRGSSVTVTTALAPWYVRAEPAALERAVVNLLDNAVKFSPPGGSVEVVLRDGELTVRDHGPGVPAEELPHVFERFWRSPAARGLPGSGLGLSIVDRAVGQAGGEVALRPAPGGGTVAAVRIPGAAHPPPDLPPGLPSAPDRPPGLPPAAPGTAPGSGPGAPPGQAS